VSRGQQRDTGHATLPVIMRFASRIPVGRWEGERANVTALLEEPYK
jgi:hypothetical protein